MLLFVGGVMMLNRDGRPANPGAEEPAPAASRPAAPVPPGTVIQRRSQNGVEVELALIPVRADGPSERPLTAGEDVTFRFTLTDAGSRQPLTNIRPAAWVVPRVADGSEPAALARRAAEFARGVASARPELDLNAFYVLTMNDDNTLTVVDPLFSFGGSKLLAQVALAGSGEDWVLTPDHDRLFVSLPAAGQVAVIDTARWTVTQSLGGFDRPTRLALQPDGHYLWVSCEGKNGNSADAGVVPISVETLKPLPLIALGRGPHEFAFDSDSRFAFVADRESGSVAVIDVRGPKMQTRVRTGPRPTAVAYSEAAHAVYVTDAGEGTVVALDARTLRERVRLEAERGLSAIRFTPNGRWGFVLNPDANRVHLLDTAADRIVQTFATDKGPDQVMLSDQFAYIRHRDSATVRLIPLDGIGNPDRPVTTAEIPGGRASLGDGGRPSRAAGLAQAAGQSAMLIANPADKMVYYYVEGMSAPQGGFSNYGRTPRAVLAVERNLRPRGLGVYETTARLPRAGTFEIIFLLDVPRCLQAFELNVQEASRPEPRSGIAVEAQVKRLSIAVGESYSLRFRLTRHPDHLPAAGLSDVVVLAFSPSSWQQRYLAQELEPGLYGASFTPPEPGIYYIHLESRAAGLALNSPARLVLQATETSK
jgi:DNA-binding beta-propeller fold protein YncE